MKKTTKILTVIFLDAATFGAAIMLTVILLGYAQGDVSARAVGGFFLILLIALNTLIKLIFFEGMYKDSSKREI